MQTQTLGMNTTTCCRNSNLENANADVTCERSFIQFTTKDFTLKQCIPSFKYSRVDAL